MLKAELKKLTMPAFRLGNGRYIEFRARVDVRVMLMPARPSEGMGDQIEFNRFSDRLQMLARDLGRQLEQTIDNIYTLRDTPPAIFQEFPNTITRTETHTLGELERGEVPGVDPEQILRLRELVAQMPQIVPGFRGLVENIQTSTSESQPANPTSTSEGQGR